jgi:hypothetical protein
VKVKMLMRIEGTRNGLRWPEAGTVVEVTETEAEGMLSTGIAEPVVEEPRKATARKAEKRG